MASFSWWQRSPLTADLRCCLQATTTATFDTRPTTAESRSESIRRTTCNYHKACCMV